MAKVEALKETVRGWPFHAACKIMPIADRRALEDLAADMQINGQRVPVELYKGKVLDGRNRLLAMVNFAPELLNNVKVVELSTEELGPSASPFRYVWSINAERRQLTQAQRSFIAAEISDKLKEDPRRQKDRLRKEEIADAKKEKTAKRQPRSSVAEAASVMKVGQKSASRAKAIAKHGTDELQQAAKDGVISLTQAEKLAKTASPKEQRKAVDEARKSPPPIGQRRQRADQLSKLKEIWKRADENERKEFKAWLRTPEAKA